MLTSRYYINDVQNVTSLTKIPMFLSFGPLHYCNGPYFLEMAHNFGSQGAIGPYACFAFPISVRAVSTACKGVQH